DGEEALRGIGRVFGRPIVVGAVGIALEGLIGVAEERHTEAAVEDLSAETIEIHVLQALGRVPTARPADGVAAPAELLELGRWNARATETGLVEGAQRFAGAEITGVAVGFVNQ